MPDIKIKNLNYKIKDKKEENVILDTLNVEFKNGDISVILGTSGSGKTTLLRCILGLNNSYSGDIYFDDENINNVATKDRNCSYVSQNLNMYPHMTLFDNISYPLKLIQTPKKEIIDRVYEIADLLNIKPLLSRKPKQVSLGELQRASIAKAIIKRPDICLLDEPFSNLDIINRTQIRLLVKKVIKKYSITTILVTHNIEDATSLADHIYIMGKGKFIYDSTPIELGKNTSLDINKYFD